MDLTKVIDTESLSYWDKIIDKIVSYLPKMLSAIIIFAIGIIISKIILKIMEKALGRSRLDKTIHSFLKSIVNLNCKRIILKLLVLKIFLLINIKFMNLIILNEF